jgi:excisionase family DNA binding protein
VKPVSLGRMMTRAEAAAVLRVTTRTVSELVRRGELATFRFGGRPRFLRADVLALRSARSARARRAA